MKNRDGKAKRGVEAKAHDGKSKRGVEAKARDGKSKRGVEAKARDGRSRRKVGATRRDPEGSSREEPAAIALHEGKVLSGVLHRPDSPSGIVCIVGHGAGSDMRSSRVAATAAGLAARGHVALRFNFPYREAGSRVPDRMPALEQAYRAAAAWLLARRRGGLLVLGGRSLGGRVASHLAAAGFACDGLVFYGYPLHPAKKPTALRDEHLPQIKAPMLFVQGTRDALCDLDLLRPVLARIGPHASLHVVSGADHSFDVLKSSGRTAAEVQDEVAGVVDAWLRARRR